MPVSISFGVLFLLAQLALGADYKKFRTCEQGSFCRRFKSFADRVAVCDPADQWKGSWAAGEEDIVQQYVGESKKFSINLTNRFDEKKKIKLDMSFYNDAMERCGVVRVQIDDLTGNRFRVPDKEMVAPEDTLLSIPGKEIRLERDSPSPTNEKNKGYLFHILNEDVDYRRRCRVHLSLDPLEIVIIKNTRALIVLNQGQLLNFELKRSKDDTNPVKPPMDYSFEDATQVDNTDLFEEKFGKFVDSKPNGPTAVGIDATFVQARHAYGFGGHASTLDLPNYQEPYRFFNSDVYEYDVDSPMALYGSLPYLMAIHYKDDPMHHDQYDHAFFSGMLWMNPSETFVRIDTPHYEHFKKRSPYSTTKGWFASETGAIDVFVMTAMNPLELTYKFHCVTGFPSFAPMWALGKHQSRWNYEDELDVQMVNKNFDAKDVPYDVLWLDIDHTDKKKYFTWDPVKFSTPLKMLKDMSKTRRRMVSIVDPHIKVDDEYAVFKTLSAVEDGFVRDAAGADFTGKCWPGDSKYPDFLNPEVQSTWADLFKFEHYKGSTERLFTWNDMNEPSVFDGPELTIPRDAKHMGNREHREVHNLYGQLVQKASYDGQLKRDPKRRPFVLSRSFFLGSHRYGPVWTGDNHADFVHMAHSVPMLLNMAISGMSFVGADVPGFFGDPTNELMIRWHQLGALTYPFYRAHASFLTLRREPWVRGPAVLEYIRQAVSVRYQLLPMWYTLMMEYSQGGRAMIRPIWFDNSDDGETFREHVQNTHIMVGDNMLVKAVTHSIDKSINDEVYLPNSLHANDGWYDYYTLNWKKSGLDHHMVVKPESLPIFIRAGSIIARKDRRRRSTDAMKNDPYTLYVYCGVDAEMKGSVSSAKGRLYIDDGDGFEYKKGKFLYMNLDYKFRTLTANKLTVPVQGKFEKDGMPSRLDGALDWPVERVSVERIVMVGNTIAPQKITFYDSTSEQDLLFHSYDMGLSHPPRFHIVIKKPPINLSKFDWRIELQGLNFGRVQKHQDMVRASQVFGTTN